MRSLTCESVCPGHPDKLADQIADAILDAALTQNPHARVACEVLLSFDNICVAGEVSGASVDYEAVARQVIRDVGYEWQPGFSGHVHGQSQNISNTVSNGGAGDQGIVYGFATQETPSLLPLALVQAHQITRYLALQRGPIIGPDGKAQVTRGEGRNAFVSIHTSHPSDAVALVRDGVCNIVGHDNVEFSCFPVGGPEADTGLTGRKLQVDTYGGVACHGGGALCGKDPTKVDRTGAYLARAIARELVRVRDLPWVEVGLAYGFGLKYPLWVSVRSDSSALHNRLHEDWVRRTFDLSPKGAIDWLNLCRPIYRDTATFGHFGRPEFPWERS